MGILSRRRGSGVITKETIVVADPEQRLAIWLRLDVKPEAGQELRVEVEGTAAQRQDFRRCEQVGHKGLHSAWVAD